MDRLHCWIAKRTTKAGERRWRAAWIDPDTNRERCRHFVRKVDAQMFLDELRGDHKTGSYIDPDAGRRLFRDYATEWADAQVHRQSTTDQLEVHLRKHILPAFGHRPLGAVRPSEVQAFVKGRSAVLAPATVTVMYRWLSTIFRAAVDDGLIRATPCRKVTLPKRAASSQLVPLGVEHVHGLAAAVDGRARALVLVAAAAGLRQGEAFGLTVDRVDFLRRTITVDRQLVGAERIAPVFGPPKSEASCRTVPIPQLLVDELAAHVATFPPSDGLLFTDSGGRPWSRARWGHHWRAAVRTAGAPAGIGYHDLRHFYASLLIAHGASVKTVQQRLGHASAMVTLDTYGHLWPDSEDQTRDAVEAVLGGSGRSGGSVPGLAGIAR